MKYITTIIRRVSFELYIYGINENECLCSVCLQKHTRQYAVKNGFMFTDLCNKYVYKIIVGLNAFDGLPRKKLFSYTTSFYIYFVISGRLGIQWYLTSPHITSGSKSIRQIFNGEIANQHIYVKFIKMRFKIVLLLNLVK